MPSGVMSLSDPAREPSFDRRCAQRSMALLGKYGITVVGYAINELQDDLGNA
jgi:hypothetical protein